MRITLFLVTVLITALAHGADLFESLGLKKAANSAGNGIAGLSQETVVSGLKEALAKGVVIAVTNLGQPDGFLKNPQVKIPLPSSLAKIEKTLRALHQDQYADEFVSTMNRAAEAAVPEAAQVLGDTVKQMSVADATGILTGTNTAATDYFRRTSGPTLQARFLPVVKKATASAGVTAAYKKMMDSSGLDGFGASLFGRESLDLDAYVTRKALDGLFLQIADQEKLIRANPAARTSDLLQQVFGAVKK